MKIGLSAGKSFTKAENCETTIQSIWIFLTDDMMLLTILHNCKEMSFEEINRIFKIERIFIKNRILESKI